VALMLLGLLALPSAGGAAPPEALSVAFSDGALSLEATDSPLDRVLAEVGKAIHAPVVVEAVPTEELSTARADASFTGGPVAAALRRLLRGRHYVVMYGASGVDELRVYRDGTTGYRELTPPDPLAATRPTSIPLAGWPPDDPSEVARLRQAMLEGPDASART